MNHINVGAQFLAFSLFVWATGAFAQQAPTGAGNAQVWGTPAVTAQVPRLVKFSGAVRDAGRKPVSSVAGITFALYQDQQGGSPLWVESQNVQPDAAGRYTVWLGASKNDGVPVELFASGQAHWLGVQVEGQPEQARVLLAAVPYALKAADAETVGGLPASAFLLAAPSTGAAASLLTSPSEPAASPADSPAAGSVTGSGIKGFIPRWSSTSTIGKSVLFQSGTGSAAEIGINTSTPAATLDINGGGIIRGTLSLPATGTATATAGNNSQPQTFAASAFNSSTNAAVSQTFRWQAEPASNNTAAPAATLNLGFGSGALAPVETGLQIASNGQVTFAAGQTFPGTGPGTITGVTAGTGLSGGGTSGNITLANTGVLAVGVGTGISETGAAYFPVLTLDTGYTDSRYLQLIGGALSGGLTLGSALTFPDGTTQATAVTSGPDGVIAVNPQQVALLKWFPAYQSQTFPVGNYPFAAAFDGASIWVTNGSSNTVTKLRASDGDCFGGGAFCTFSVGTDPIGVVFDGANIWVANHLSNNVTKLRASDGACVGICTFNVGNNPNGVAFDGTYIWVTNGGSNTVTKLRASDGAYVGTFNAGNNPNGVAFDGTNIWVANTSGSNTVTKLRASDGACVGTCTFSVGPYPNGVAFDGANIWVTNAAGNTVTKLRASDGACVGTCTFGVGSNPNGVAFDGANIWVANTNSNSVTKLRASDGACVGTCTFSVGTSPSGVAFDGANIWVTNRASNTVSKL